MKEKLDKKILLAVQKTLYEDFQETCEKQYKTKSEVIRDFMIQYIKKYKKCQE